MEHRSTVKTAGALPLVQVEKEQKQKKNQCSVKEKQLYCLC